MKEIFRYSALYFITRGLALILFLAGPVYLITLRQDRSAILMLISGLVFSGILAYSLFTRKNFFLVTNEKGMNVSNRVALPWALVCRMKMNEYGSSTSISGITRRLNFWFVDMQSGTIKKESFTHHLKDFIHVKDMFIKRTGLDVHGNVKAVTCYKCRKSEMSLSEDETAYVCPSCNNVVTLDASIHKANRKLGILIMMGSLGILAGAAYFFMSGLASIRKDYLYLLGAAFVCVVFAIRGMSMLNKQATIPDPDLDIKWTP